MKILWSPVTQHEDSEKIWKNSPPQQLINQLWWQCVQQKASAKSIKLWCPEPGWAWTDWNRQACQLQSRNWWEQLIEMRNFTWRLFHPFECLGLLIPFLPVTIKQRFLKNKITQQQQTLLDQAQPNFQPFLRTWSLTQPNLWSFPAKGNAHSSNSIELSLPKRDRSNAMAQKWAYAVWTEGLHDFFEEEKSWSMLLLAKSQP